jgi:hypothetical protein
MESPNNPFVASEGGLCSFCEKERPKTEKLAEAPRIKICVECAELCIDIMSEDDHGSPPSAEDWQKALGRLKATQQAWNQSKMKDTPPPLSSEQPMMSMKAEQLATLLNKQSEPAQEVVIKDPALVASLVCSICNKAREKVQRLIAGPNDVKICNQCVGQAVRVLNP